MAQETSNASVTEQAFVESALRYRRARPTDFLLFFRKFMNKGLAISSAIPSSRSLVNTVLEQIDFDRPSTIVELGAGTGPVTEEILDRLRPHHRFVAIEIDPDFCAILRRRFPEATLLQADAAQIAEPLANMGVRKVDYVISCLPTPNLPNRAKIALWKWLHETLAPDGLFIQITNVPLYYRNFYDRFFESVDFHMVWMNFPPGGVYRCAKLRKHLAKKSR